MDDARPLAKSQTKEYKAKIQQNNYIKNRDKRIFCTVKNYYYKVLGHAVVDDVLQRLGEDLGAIRLELRKLDKLQKAQLVLAAGISDNPHPEEATAGEEGV